MFIAIVVGFVFGIKVAVVFGFLLLYSGKRIGNHTGYHSNHMVITPVVSILLTILSIVLVEHQWDLSAGHPYNDVEAYLITSTTVGAIIPFLGFWFFTLFKDFEYQLGVNIAGSLTFVALTILFFAGYLYLSTALFTLFFASLQYYHYRMTH